MGSERRKANRIFVKVPLTLEAGKGVTRDVNATGVYFESDVDCVVGSEIGFSLNFDNQAHPMELRCKGLVVRVEQQQGRRGIAVQIIASNFLAASKCRQDAVYTPQ